jgi:hypothetical protein
MSKTLGELDAAMANHQAMAAIAVIARAELDLPPLPEAPAVLRAAAYRRFPAHLLPGPRKPGVQLN